MSFLSKMNSRYCHIFFEDSTGSSIADRSKKKRIKDILKSGKMKNFSLPVFDNQAEKRRNNIVATKK